jgi:uronate dehydrogenase
VTALVAVTGAAGAIGSVVCAGLDRGQFRLRLLDVAAPRLTGPADDVRLVDLRDAAATRQALDGVAAVVHLAARPDEGSFAEIHDRNVLTTYNVYEAARQVGVRRVVFASSVHVAGFTAWGRRCAPTDPPRPDTHYALSKLYGEALGSMYADRYGIEVVNLRIGGFAHDPDQPAFLWGWLSPADTVRLVTAALTAPALRCVTCYGVSNNTRRFHTDDGWDEIGYQPRDDAEQYAHRWPRAVPPALQGMEFTDPSYTGH